MMARGTELVNRRTATSVPETPLLPRGAQGEIMTALGLFAHLTHQRLPLLPMRAGATPMMSPYGQMTQFMNQGVPRHRPARSAQ
jgi:hypothetical protein